MTTNWTRRRIGALGLGSIAWLAGSRLAAAAAPDPAALVDPELRPVLDQMKALAMPPFTVENLPQLRQAMGRFGGPRLADPAVVERRIDGPPGAPQVRVFVINAGAGARPAILHIHGGGYVTGSPEANIADLQRTALRRDCVVVSVDYRLAPETRFPGSLEDNYAALRWLQSSSAELGVDPARIVVMGESAGGGHAAALAIAARDRGQIALAGQVLVYPMLDDRTGSVRPTPPHQGAWVWTAAQNRLGWEALLGVPAGSPNPPPGAVPARVADLSGLPPAFIGVGALDLFVDEDVDYARRLVDAGVPTELVVAPGAFHGFNGIAPQARVSQRFNAAIDAALARFFARA